MCVYTYTYIYCTTYPLTLIFTVAAFKKQCLHCDQLSACGVGKRRNKRTVRLGFHDNV